MPRKRPTADGSALGIFLSSRRAGLNPSEAGLAVDGYRRVAGLRREEVAVLAGVSADYYTRLEQGRERHPSAQVLDAVSRVLQLGPDEHDHLYHLTGVAPPLDELPTAVDVGPELRLLLGQLRESPALVLSSSFDVLARNELAQALHRGFTLNDNSARMCFLDPLGRTFYENWASTAEGVVAGLRLAAGQSPYDQRLMNVIEELTVASPEFQELWSRQTVRAKSNEIKHLFHPDVGAIALDYQSFDVRGKRGQQLVVFTARTGSPSAMKLRQLAGLSAGDAPET